MEAGIAAARYWCHMCSQVVNPIMEAELKCPFCHSGFVEDMDSRVAVSGGLDESDFASDRALSLWAPILLGIMGNPHRRRRFRIHFLDDHEERSNHFDDSTDGVIPGEGETELDRELDSIIRRRRRSSVTILQLLQSIRAGMVADAEIHSRSARAGERERIIIVNPFHQTIVVQGAPDHDQNQSNERTFGALSDYFIGPGLELLLQHLADNDPNRYGTPPAQRDAIEALLTVNIEENLQCSVCLDDFDLGTEAKEMPCKHKFHSGCLMPWLELHSSCPVCRYQLPADESKTDLEGSRNSSNGHEGQSIPGRDDDGQREERNGPNERRYELPWPFSTLFSSLGPSSSVGDPSSMPLASSSSSRSSTTTPETD